MAEQDVVSGNVESIKRLMSYLDRREIGSFSVSIGSAEYPGLINAEYPGVVGDFRYDKRGIILEPESAPDRKAKGDNAYRGSFTFAQIDSGNDRYVFRIVDELFDEKKKSPEEAVANLRATIMSYNEESDVILERRMRDTRKAA